MKPKHSDSDVGWIKREFAKIRGEMAQDRAAKKLQASTIGKGGLTVKDGGKIATPYPTGQGTGDALYIGPFNDGLIGYRVVLNASDGSPILQATSYPPQTDAPSGLTTAGFTADIVGLSAATAMVLQMESTTDGVNIAVGEVGVTSTGRVLIQGGSGGVQIVHSTTGASANCFIDPSNNRIWRSTSSRRYKQDIEDSAVDPADVMKLVGRTWRDKGQVETNPDETTRYTGFIAEELDELPSLRQFVIYDDQGRPDAIAYDRLSVAILAVLKSFDSRLTALEQAATEH